MHGAPFSWCRQSQPPQDQKTTDTIYLQFIQRDETSTLYRYTGATFIAHKQTSHAAFLTTSNQMTHTQHHEHHLFLPCAIISVFHFCFLVSFCYFSVSFTIRIPSSIRQKELSKRQLHKALWRANTRITRIDTHIFSLFPILTLCPNTIYPYLEGHTRAHTASNCFSLFVEFEQALY